MFVVTADQVASRRGPDLVPAALQAIAEARVSALGPEGDDRGFERAAGDEVQGVVIRAGEVVGILTALLRTGRFRVGVGIGTVEQPLPASVRAGRGPAFVAARAAVEAAERSGPVAVRYAADDPAGARHTELAEHALVLLARVLAARSGPGWQVCDLMACGRTQREAAASLGISASAVSQRLRRAGWAEQLRAADLAEHHLGLADRARVSVPASRTAT